MSTWVYTAFGEPIYLDTTRDEPADTSFGYQGGHGVQGIEDGGLLRVGRRYYDPRTGRFLQPIPCGRPGGGYPANGQGPGIAQGIKNWIFVGVWDAPEKAYLDAKDAFNNRNPFVGLAFGVGWAPKGSPNRGLQLAAGYSYTVYEGGGILAGGMYKGSQRIRLPKGTFGSLSGGVGGAVGYGEDGFSAEPAIGLGIGQKGKGIGGGATPNLVFCGWNFGPVFFGAYVDLDRLWAD